MPRYWSWLVSWTVYIVSDMRVRVLVICSAWEKMTFFLHYFTYWASDVADNMKTNNRSRVRTKSKNKEQNRREDAIRKCRLAYSGHICQMPVTPLCQVASIDSFHFYWHTWMANQSVLTSHFVCKLVHGWHNEESSLAFLIPMLSQITLFWKIHCTEELSNLP